MNYLENKVRIAVDNLTVSFTNEGQIGAPVIIFIHGFPFNKSMWNKQVDALKENYHVIAYDVRGHGNSDAGNREFSIELFVKDLISLLDALQIDKAILCGLSMGGYIALNAIVNYPSRFNGLILSDTNCIADSPEAKEKRMKAIESIGKNGVVKYAGESIKNLFAPKSFKTNKKEITAIKNMIVATSEHTLFSTLLALSVRSETCSKLSLIKVPVLIMVGNEDVITPPSAAQLMHEKIKNSLRIIIDDAGHLSNMENPGDFNDHLSKFVKSIYKKTISL